MLAGVLRSDVAVAMSIAIVRAFVRMREIITTNKDIAARIGKLEYANDHAASVIEDLARDIANLAEEVEQMKIIPPPTKRKIGFCIDED
jgi:hypothetical protein